MIRLKEKSFKDYQGLADWLADGDYDAAYNRLHDFAKFIGGGSYRQAWLLPKLKLVAKLDGHTRGRANRNEWRYYHSRSRWHRQFYAKPKAISKDGSIILLEYVPLLLSADELDRWRKVVAKHIPYNVRCDAFGDNVRKKSKTSKPVIVDYQTVFFQ